MKALEEGLCGLDSNLWDTRPWGNIRPARMQEVVREGLASQAEQAEQLESLGKALNWRSFIGAYSTVMWRMEGKEPNWGPSSCPSER